MMLSDFCSASFFYFELAPDVCHITITGSKSATLKFQTYSFSMIILKTLFDINWKNVQAVAYDDEKLKISAELLTVVESGRQKFNELINAGVPCYGVTTGLGKLVNLDLSEEERSDLPHNILPITLESSKRAPFINT